MPLHKRLHHIHLPYLSLCHYTAACVEMEKNEASHTNNSPSEHSNP